MNIDVKLCKDCKWLEKSFFIWTQYRYCMHPNSQVDLVDGAKQFANIRRQRECGPQGIDWEQK